MVGGTKTKTQLNADQVVEITDDEATASIKTGRFFSYYVNFKANMRNMRRRTICTPHADQTLE